MVKKTIVFNGEEWAEKKLALLRGSVEKLIQERGRSPKLVVLMAGENKASKVYIREKKEAAEKIGVDFELVHFPSSINPEAVIQSIKVANEDELVDGVMVQLPIEIKNCNLKFKILNSIEVKKDVDCLTDGNLQLVKVGKPRFLPATVKAVLEILGVSTRGANRKPPSRCNRFAPWEILAIIRNSKSKIQNPKIVVVGAEGFVGKPLVWVLENKGWEVEGIDLETKDIGRVARQADVLISATGQLGLIKKEMVKKGAVVIDVGYPKGDVDFQKVKEKTSFITPAPGGVGPVTVVSLMENLLVASWGSLG